MKISGIGDFGNVSNVKKTGFGKAGKPKEIKGFTSEKVDQIDSKASDSIKHVDPSSVSKELKGISQQICADRYLTDKKLHTAMRCALNDLVKKAIKNRYQ